MSSFRGVQPRPSGYGLAGIAFAKTLQEDMLPTGNRQFPQMTSNAGYTHKIHSETVCNRKAMATMVCTLEGLCGQKFANLSGSTCII